MITWQQWLESIGQGPLAAPVQSAMNSYNPQDVTQRCGTCGQSIDDEGIQTGMCSTCGNKLDQSKYGLQKFDTQKGRVVQPTDKIRKPIMSGGWQARRGFN